jgi:branched-chain amino acid transport system ATP-binding protein
MLELDHVNAGYGRAQVLREFSLKVAPGEILCLLGRNGAGKTTAMKAAMGLLPLMSGRVLLDGRELSRLPAHEVPRAGLGYIPQGRQALLRADRGAKPRDRARRAQLGARGAGRGA